MAVRIRLQRYGANKRPFYRLVASESTSPRDGKFIEILGTYNAISNPAEVKVDEAKILTWLQQGALPTDTVRSILSKEGIMAKFAEAKKNKKA